MDSSSRVYVAGHRGLVGSAIVRRLQDEGINHLVTRTRTEYNLTEAGAVEQMFQAEKPEYIFLAAAKVGGIHANRTWPADFIRENLAIQTNVIDAAHRHGVKKLLFLGSSCIYPKHAPQPMKEEHLLTGPLEPTNEPYAIAKIAGLKMAEAYTRQHGLSTVSLMPTNLYGPNDNFDLETSHVLPALIRRFHEAKESGATEVECWGTGSPRREFLHADDLADAAVHLMRHRDDPAPINVGVGEDVSIKELAEMIARAVGYEGAIRWNTDMPDGTPRKLLDVSLLAEEGWRAKIGLEEGIRSTYEWFLSHPA